MILLAFGMALLGCVGGSNALVQAGSEAGESMPQSGSSLDDFEGPGEMPFNPFGTSSSANGSTVSSSDQARASVPQPFTQTGEVDPCPDNIQPCDPEQILRTDHLYRPLTDELIHSQDFLQTIQLKELN